MQASASLLFLILFTWFFSHCDEVSGPFCRCDMVSKCMYTICKNLVLRVSVSSITNEKFMCQKFSLHFCSLETQHTLSSGSFWSVPNWPPLPLMLVALLTLPAHHCPSKTTMSFGCSTGPCLHTLGTCGTYLAR